MYDVIFILEANLATSVLPSVKHYTAYANPNLKLCIHCGIAVYEKNDYSKNIFDLSYGECYITFRFNFAPNYIFGGVYIQPENAGYFNPSMCAQLASILSHCVECNYIPYIGGDFNARLGNWNLLSKSWHYSNNIDTITNKYGRTFMTDICKRNNIYPINHLKYKHEKKSQIDFILTNCMGREFITSFSDQNWHISDHRPVYLNMYIDYATASSTLLVRAEDLNYEFSPDTPGFFVRIPKFHLSLIILSCPSNLSLNLFLNYS